MKLHTMKRPIGSARSKKRVGRGEGSGKGKTSGRGHKGYKSRSGSRIKAGYEGGQMPLQRRLPKRGFHPIRKTVYQAINIRDLERHPQVVKYHPEVMKELGLIRRLNRPVKVLGSGSIERKIHVRAHAFSRTAREKIVSAGGEVEIL